MTVGSVYEWKYQVDIAQGASLSAIGDIKANFNTPTQTSGLLLSEKISAAEAPAAAELSMLMFALGVFAVALRRS
jgi:hypothetical protein